MDVTAPVIDFTVAAIEPVTLDATQGDGLFAGHDLMSPYVWQAGEGFDMLVRVLKNPLGPGDPTGVIYCGHSRDGLHFTMQATPVITPGPRDVDAGGVEDPTVVAAGDDRLMVYFTGVDAQRQQGSLLVASGSRLDRLEKGPVMLKAPAGEGNIKEATIARGADGRFRLFYEYAREIRPGHAASRIGMALAESLEGPWQSVDDPFTVRDDGWDNWHLSTGPILARPGAAPIMFYNGATADARWRIGWIAFDADYTRIVARCVEPLIMPPPPRRRAGTDIAFAASCIDGPDGAILYYSLEDRELARARLRYYGP